MAFMVHDNEVMDGGFSYTSLDAAEADLENDLLPDGTNIYIKGTNDNTGLFYKVVDGELIPFGGGAEIPYFATQELADAAILAGDLKEGDYYAVGNDSLYDMEYDAENELLVVSDDLVDYDAETETLEIEM